MEPIIQVKNLGKRYNISHQRGRYIALRDVIMYIVKRPFAFMKTKIKNAVGLETREEFWALRNISFDVMPGEVIGIIGHNGAGKSTMLKILSGITPPTEGEITLRGRVSSLLEVGTGFHPELTGRENIFLNGAILGMTRKEIAEKFDEIVAFAGVEQFLDTPVKYFSSGMYVRLAFSVAAHMEPDILIVDEVLAVGDAEFQKKCLGKMEEVRNKEGRTILFVSHNLAAIQQLCKKTILLEKGQVSKMGETEEVINYYLTFGKDLDTVINFTPRLGAEGQIIKISILNERGAPSAKLPMYEDFSIQIEFVMNQKVEGAMLLTTIISDGVQIIAISDADEAGKLIAYDPGKYLTTIIVPSSLLNVGHYYLEVSLIRLGKEYLDKKENISFEIQAENSPRSALYQNQIPGKIGILLECKTLSLPAL